MLVDSRPVRPAGRGRDDLRRRAARVVRAGKRQGAGDPVASRTARWRPGDPAAQRRRLGALDRDRRISCARCSGAQSQHHHFLYASSGPSVGQWLVAHGDGGRLIGGAVKLTEPSDSIGRLHAGEVVEITVTNISRLQPMLDEAVRRAAR